MTEDVIELLRIYESLDTQGRANVLASAYEEKCRCRSSASAVSSFETFALNGKTIDETGKQSAQLAAD